MSFFLALAFVLVGVWALISIGLLIAAVLFLWDETKDFDLSSALVGVILLITGIMSTAGVIAAFSHLVRS